MRIADRYGGNRPVFSFEFFPAKTEKGFRKPCARVAELKLLAPDFVSVTWGAGGSTRSKTVESALDGDWPADIRVCTLNRTRAIFQRPLER